MGDVLFLAHRVPYPPDRGDKIRSYHVLRHIAERARVHLIAFADDSTDRHHQAVLASVAVSYAIIDRTKSKARATLEALLTGRPASLTAFASATVSRLVEDILSSHEIETIFVFSGQMAQFVPRSFSGRVVMDFVDVDSAKFAGYAKRARPPLCWLLEREARLLGAFEQQVASRVDASLFVSDAEAELFRASGGTRVLTIENGIDTDRFDPEASFEKVDLPGPLIVFTGQMDYRPNIDAVDDFARRILPLVQAAVPSARFAIVGRNPGRQVEILGALAGVSVTGAVPDVRGWLAAAAVVVAPLRIARGVQNKVLEAMAMARPVVVSSAAAEGIDHRGTIIVTAGREDSAARIVDLLGDRAAARALGACARSHVIQRYGWEARLAALNPVMGFERTCSKRSVT